MQPAPHPHAAPPPHGATDPDHGKMRKAASDRAQAVVWIWFWITLFLLLALGVAWGLMRHTSIDIPARPHAPTLPGEPPRTLP